MGLEYVAALWDGFLICLRGRKSVILGFWAAPGASGAISLGAGAWPPPFERVSGAPQTTKIANFRPLENYDLYGPPKVQPRIAWAGLSCYYRNGYTIDPTLPWCGIRSATKNSSIVQGAWGGIFQSVWHLLGCFADMVLRSGASRDFAANANHLGHSVFCLLGT